VAIKNELDVSDLERRSGVKFGERRSLPFADRVQVSVDAEASSLVRLPVVPSAAVGSIQPAIPTRFWWRSIDAQDREIELLEIFSENIVHVILATALTGLTVTAPVLIGSTGAGMSWGDVPTIANTRENNEGSLPNSLLIAAGVVLGFFVYTPGATSAMRSARVRVRPGQFLVVAHEAANLPFEFGLAFREVLSSRPVDASLTG